MSTIQVKPGHREEVPAKKVQNDPQILDELLRNVNPACAAEIRSFCREHSSMASHQLSKMWAQGKRLEQLKDPKYKQPSVGEGVVDPCGIVAAATGESDSMLNKTAQFYRAFKNQEQRDRILSLRAKTSGRPLSWSHFQQLLKWHSDTGDNTAFEAMLQKSLENDWSPEEIERYHKTERLMAGKTASRGGGRPTVIPTTFHGRITKMLIQAETMVKHSGEIYHHPSNGFAAAVEGMSQSEISSKSEEMVCELSQLRVSLRKLRDICDEQLETIIPDLVERVRGSAQGRARQRGVDEAAALEAVDAGGK